MIELQHYSTFPNPDAFKEEHRHVYATSFQATYMGIDDRTKWAAEYINESASESFNINFDIEKFAIVVDGNEVSIRELTKTLPAPASKPLIDATSLSYPEIQYLFFWLMSIESAFDVLYVEPENYQSNKEQSVDNYESYQLSEDGPGILQLPPFLGSTQDKTIDVISIGYEGHRVAGLFNNDQLNDPGFDNIRLVVGVPAFKAGFDRISLKNNSSALERINSAGRREVMYASANNPFSMTTILERVYRSTNFDDSNTHNINLIPFGTKPSAIGMAWFAVKYQDQVTVTYDNVIKSPGRSYGVGKVHLAKFY